jgi:GGDEF domain-containing protein
MSLQGPIIIAREEPVAAMIEALAAAGAFPLIEVRLDELPTAIAAIEPAAIILADGAPASGFAKALAQALAKAGGAYIPVMECRRAGIAALFPEAIPVAAQAPPARLVARLRAALRTRTLHAAVLRRAWVLADRRSPAPEIAAGDPLSDTTVIVAGRGRSYPALSVAVGERMGLIGALSLEAATGFLAARDIDGLVIGDGFNRRVVEAVLADLSADPRFRDLPVAVLDDGGDDIDPERLPNFERFMGDPAGIVAAFSPMVRLHGFAARLRRLQAALDTRGDIDSETGLRSRDAFMRDLAQAISEAHDRGLPLSLARFALDSFADRRASVDASRIVGRLTRAVDFACRDADGTILVAFTETALRSAHVVARRIASVLKHTTLSPGRDRARLDPTVAIAALKSGDSAASLIARVAADGMVAVG